MYAVRTDTYAKCCILKASDFEEEGTDKASFKPSV